MQKTWVERIAEYQKVVAERRLIGGARWAAAVLVECAELPEDDQTAFAKMADRADLFDSQEWGGIVFENELVLLLDARNKKTATPKHPDLSMMEPGLFDQITDEWCPVQEIPLWFRAALCAWYRHIPPYHGWLTHAFDLHTAQHDRISNLLPHLHRLSPEAWTMLERECVARALGTTAELCAVGKDHPGHVFGSRMKKWAEQFRGGVALEDDGDDGIDPESVTGLSSIVRSANGAPGSRRIWQVSDQISLALLMAKAANTGTAFGRQREIIMNAITHRQLGAFDDILSTV